MSGIIDCKMHIGDEVFVHGYIDEIRNDTIIIRNVGGYFGTSRDEVFYYEEDGTMNADRKTEPRLEQFGVGLEYHTDIVNFGKPKGESITTNKTKPQTSGVVWTEETIKNEPMPYTTWASTKPQTEGASDE